jgi:hypothetical protein
LSRDETNDDPIDSDLDADDDPDGPATDVCASCGREILADTIACPYCGEVTDKPARAPGWVFWAAVALLAAMALAWAVR